MGKWGFIWLAYGVAGGLILAYLASLWRRLRRAAAEAAALERDAGRGGR